MRHLYLVIEEVHNFDWEKKNVVCATHDHDVARFIANDKLKNREYGDDCRVNYRPIAVPIIDTVSDYVRYEED